MKLTTIILLLACLSASAKSYSQKVSLSERNVRLEKVFKKIEDQTRYQFLYTDEILKPCSLVNIKLKNVSLQKALDELLNDQPLSYAIIENTIIIKPKELPKPKAAKEVFIEVNHEVKGRITGEGGQPLSGVSIKIRGTAKGTTTDEQGNFTLQDVNENAILEVSFVGYKSQAVAVGSQAYIEIKLDIEINDLQAVEVSVAYGTQKKKEVVGSVAQVDFDDTRDMPAGHIGQRLQGRLPGVEIIQSTGRPGQGMSFRVRGAASINASNSPLVVVDGTPIIGGININPEEVETVTVLKDAAASSLYGARAASGVILITTKKAKAGQSRIDISTNYGIASVPKQGRPPMMNGTEFATYMKWLFEDKAKYEGYTGGIPAVYQNPEQYGNGTDWYDIMLRKAPTQEYNLSILSGNDKSKTSGTINYFNQQGVMINTGYQRYSGRLNHETRIKNRVTVGVNLAPSLLLEHNTRASAATDQYRLGIMGAMLSSPIAPAVNPDGSLPLTATSFNLFNSVNWYRKAQELVDNWKTTRILSNVFAEVDIVAGLKYRSSANTDVGHTTQYYWEPSTARGNSLAPGDNRAVSEFNTNNFFSWLLENTLDYSKKINDHSIKLLAGYSAQKYRAESGNASGNTFPDDDIPYINAAINKTSSSGTSSWALVSMIGRLNYSFKEKYLFQAAIRRDGSSRFGSQSQYGYFPSVGAGWLVSNENFMKNINAVSYLKIRGSYGLLGNDAFNAGNYPSLAGINSGNTYSYVFNNTLSPGKTIAGLGNTLLSWEKTKQLDVGIDIGILNDRILLTYDYYHKLINGLLYQVNVPLSSGYSSISANIGEFEFWGHELSIASKNTTGQLKWNTTFNITFNRNIVNKLGTNDLPIGTLANPTADFITVVGKPMGQFIGYIFDGVYMNQAEFDSQPKHSTSRVGSVRMKDISGPDGVPDGKIDVNDVTIIGDPNPKFIFGFTNDFTYKQFDLNIHMAGSVGGKILNQQLESTLLLDGLFNMDKSLLNLWRSEENPGNGLVPRSMPSTTNLYRTNNSSWVFSGSYLTAKNISLGYTQTFKPNKYLNTMRVFVSIQQAFIITKYPGSNPEVSSNGLNGLSQGMDLGAYPVPRVISIGINLGL
ncbi:MAG: TonB-dependent receptor [Niabella sp.]